MTVNKVKHQARLEQWRNNIIECRSSGESVIKWCARHGCDKSTFYRWERELFGDNLKGKTDFSDIECIQTVVTLDSPALVELPVELPAVAPPQVQPTNTVCGFQPVAVVHIGNYELELSNLVSTELMQQLKELVNGVN